MFKFPRLIISKRLPIALSISLSITSCSFIKPLNKKKGLTQKQVKTKASKISIIEKRQRKQIRKHFTQYKVKTKGNTIDIKEYCDKVDKYFEKYSWGKSKCHDYSWNHVRSSYYGNPIVWFVYGNESKKENKNVTFIECGVHGDEITPIKFCYDLLEDLRYNPEKIGEDNLVVISPIVTPDAFFRKKPTRTNARGVDINRNFPTKDWERSALKLWKSRYKSDKRRFPGNKALSEQETIFQVNIIKRYKPKKVISVHAPLTMLDYDGPHFTQERGKAAKQLLVTMSDKAGKYKISNYPFFTGSLGNWAGNERDIPTYTLELPNTDWHKTSKYYRLFREAILHAINDKLK